MTISRLNNQPPGKIRELSLKKSLAGLLTAILAMTGLVVMPSVALAAPNAGIVINNPTLTNETHTGSDDQTVVGDTLLFQGEWDASAANPQPGDEFTIVLPSELAFPSNISFPLAGSDGASWGTCVTDAETETATCTLNETVTERPELVSGTFAFEVKAVQATEETTVEFVLNGIGTPVEVPGGKGIDDGIDVTDEWSKNGELNSNKWSMTWTIELPGSKLKGFNPVHVSDTLSDNHQLCADPSFKITAVRGDTKIDVTSLGEIVTPGTKPGSTFDIVLTEPDGGWDAGYTYQIQYNTCTPDETIDPVGTVYTNSAYVDVWGEGIDGIGVTQDWNFDAAIKKNGTILGGADRNGKIRWDVSLSGTYLFGKDGFTFEDTMTGNHQLCADALDSVKIYQQYGPTTQRRIDVTDEFEVTASEISADRKNFTLDVAIKSDSDFTFKEDPYIYVIVYNSCATTDGLPAGGEEFANQADVDGAVVGTEKEVPNRTDQKTGAISSKTVTLDGVEHLPQTTIDWTITIPGERLADLGSALTVTDKLSETHQVCEAGDPTDGLKAQLGLKVQAQDQISKGGLETQNLTDSVTASQEGDTLTFTVPQPTLPQPGGGEATGFSREYQYVFTYTTCTTSGGMDAPGTTYANGATANGKEYTTTVTQEYKGSGTGSGVTRGSASVSKALTAHIDTSALGDDFPTQPDRELTLTAGEPLVIDNLPIGSVVTFTETKPVDDDLLTWGVQTFSPESITVTADHVVEAAEVTLTNAVERSVGTFSLVKTVTGDQKDNPAVPENVTVTATWNQEGTPGEKTLTVPTDGTPVSFGENLLIGTNVTLTETPLADGSSIAWGAPTWSGTGVAVDVNSAVVTIGRTADATVTLENHAATSVAGISILKGVAGEAAGEVDPETEFPVTAAWKIGDEEFSKELKINAINPTPLGEDLPAGTVVTITEGTQPGFDTVVWGSITISGKDVTDLGDGVAEVVVSDQQGDVTLVTVVNEATWAPGTFELSKDVTGVLLNNSDVPESVTVTASWIGVGMTISKEIVIPTDGTVVAFGEDLPYGTEVTLSEDVVSESDAFTWDTPVWEADGIRVNEDGTATIVIGAATNTSVKLTNNATATLGSLSILKSLSGDGASAVPVGTVFPVTASWTDLLGEKQQVELEVVAGKATVLADLPFGTEVTLKESAAKLPSDVQWTSATWSASSENAVVTGEGKQVVVTVTGDVGDQANLKLDNEFKKTPKLPNTGSNALAAGLIGLGLLAGGGALMVLRRRRES